MKESYIRIVILAAGTVAGYVAIFTPLLILSPPQRDEFWWIFFVAAVIFPATGKVAQIAATRFGESKIARDTVSDTGIRGEDTDLEAE